MLQFMQQICAKMVLTSDSKLWYLSDKKLDVSNRKYSRRTLNIITKDLLAKSYNSGLNISNLADGVYSITENMVKVDKTTASMSDTAINHLSLIHISEPTRP